MFLTKDEVKDAILRAMGIIILVIAAFCFYYFIGTASTGITQAALAGAWTIMAIACVVSILGVLLFG